MPDNPATVFVVEDDLSTSRALKRLLEAFGYQTRVFDTGSELMQSGSIKSANCILLDVGLPDLNGLEIQSLLANDGYSVPIVFLTGDGDVPMSVRAMRGGAIDFLLKPVDERDLLMALERAISIRQETAETEQAKDSMLERVATLTPREMDVFRCVLTGAMNKQIAGYLGIAEKTVKVHRGRVMEKLQANTIVDLIEFATLCGIAAEHNLHR